MTYDGGRFVSKVQAGTEPGSWEESRVYVHSLVQQVGWPRNHHATTMQPPRSHHATTSLICQVGFPRDEDGEIEGMIHPSLQDGDFMEPLAPGAPAFLAMDGQTVIPFEPKPDAEGNMPTEPLYPFFINEVAAASNPSPLSVTYTPAPQTLSPLPLTNPNANSAGRVL